MKIKTMLLAVMAAAALAFAALPALASAAEVDFPGAGHFTVSGGKTKLVAGTNVECESVTGTGEFSTTTTGTVQLLFHECTAAGTPCWSPDQEEEGGTISTRVLPFHIVEVNGAPAVLITPGAEGTFATFFCVFGLVHVHVVGNGVIGTITAPAPNTLSPSFTMSFTATGASQNHKTIDGSTTEYHLQAIVNGEAPEEAAQVGEGTGTFTEGEGELTE